MKRKEKTQRKIFLAFLARGDGAGSSSVKIPLLAVFISALSAPYAVAEEKATWSALLENDYFGSKGVGSEVMRRIAAPMIGGIASATVLALVVIPAVWFLWNRRAITDAQLTVPAERLAPAE